MTDLSPEVARERAERHLTMAQRFEAEGLDDVAAIHYNECERTYIDAGLDADWFGAAHFGRTCSRPVIPGHE